MKYRRMNGGDLQNLREVLSLDYKDALFFLGATKLRGPLDGSPESVEPIKLRELSILVRLLTKYPGYAVIGPRLEGREILQIFSSDFYDKYSKHGIRALKLRIEFLSKALASELGDEVELRNHPEQLDMANRINRSLQREMGKIEQLEELTKVSLQLIGLYEAGGRTFARMFDGNISSFALSPLSVEERVRAEILVNSLQKRTGSQDVHPGRVSIALGKKNHTSGYTWASDEQVSIPKIIQRLATIVRQMVFDLGEEGLWRYLLVVDEDAYSEGHADGLLSILKPEAK